jgi:type IV secretion system protein TrbI
VSTTPQSEPVVQQRAATPPGNIPKGRQTYIMLGIAVVIVLSIVFSGSATKTVKPGTNLPPLNVSTPSKSEIDSYAAALNQAEQQAKLAEAQAERSKEMFRQVNAQGGVPAANAGMQGGIPGQALIGPDGKAYYPVNVQNQAVAPPEKSAVLQEKEKMDFTSLFASPVALSLRSPAAGAAPPAGPSASTIVTTPAVVPLVAASPEFVRPGIPHHVLFEGTILEAVLTNRLAGSFAGPVNCMVTTNVYSHDHNLLIVPQGSRVLGEAKRVAEQQQQRLAVSFHRLIMPDGYSVNLDQFPGVDQTGATGLKDKTNNHYLETFGTSIALGVLAGFSQFGTGSALTAGGFDSYRQGVASQVSQNSSTVLQRQLNRLPDITVREGQRVKIYLMRDLELPAYAGHPGRGDL